MNDNKSIVSNENNINNITNVQNSSIKKKKNPTNILKVALYMLKMKNNTPLSKHKKSKSSADLPNATNATISRLVGSARPLHLQNGGTGGQSPPPLPPFSSQISYPGESSPEGGETVAGVAVEMSQHVYEPSLLNSSSQGSCSSSFKGMSRQYTSAPNLCDLDVHGDEETNYDGIEGDEMIDSKAEMFIAKMYQQMRLQDIK